MTTVNDIYDAIRKADAAGDGDSVRKLGAYLQTLNAPTERASSTVINAALNTVGAVGEPILKMLTGAGAKFAGDTVGLARTGINLATGDSSIDPAQLKQDVQNTLTYEPKTALGKTVTNSPLNPINVIGNIVGKGANAAGNYVAGDNPGPLNEAAGNAVREAIPQALSIAGVGFPKTAGYAASGIAPPAAAYVGGKILGAGYNLTEPYLPKLPLMADTGNNLIAGRTFNMAAGDARSQVIDALLSHENQVRGSNLTAGQAAVGAQAPVFSALQKEAESVNPDLYYNLAKDQQAARARVVQDIAGGATPEAQDAALEAAIAERKKATAPYFKEAESSKAKVDAKPVMEIIQKYLQDNPKNDSITVPLTSIKSDLIASPSAPAKTIYGPISKTEIPEKSVVLENNPKALRSLSENIDNMLEAKNAADGSPQFNIKALTEIKDALDAQIANVVPAYAAGLAKHAEMSIPINRLQVGRVLTNKLFSPTAQEGANPFLGATGDANVARTIKSATDFGGNDAIDQVLSPKQTADVNAVIKELQNNIELGKQAQAGTPALGTMIAEQLGPAKIPQLLTIKASLSNYFYNLLTGRAGKKTMQTIADAMQSPEETARLMQNAPLPDSTESIVNAIMRRYGQAASIGLPAQAQ